MPTNNVLTHANQPDNVGAWRLGEACRAAKPGGDLIDRGLSLLKELEARGYGVIALTAHPGQPDCWCETCRPITLTDMRMVLCPTCGNKRCPHATNHRNACTGSNEPGQPGSSWEHVKPVGQPAPRHAENPTGIGYDTPPEELERILAQPEPRDAIARSKRILGLVDEYHENPTRDMRTALRVALMDEFQPEPRAEATDADKQDAARYRWLRDVSVPPHNFYLSVPIEFDGVRYTRAEVDAEIDAAIDAARAGGA